jgi:hypothetical protein
MYRTRSLLARVQRLEHALNPQSPIEIMYGSLEAWEAEVQQCIDMGKLCPRDVPILIHCIRRWHREGVWSMWRRRGRV